jgi:hypothetical protein
MQRPKRCGQSGFPNRLIADSRLVFAESRVGSWFNVGQGMGVLRRRLHPQRPDSPGRRLRHPSQAQPYRPARHQRPHLRPEKPCRALLLQAQEQPPAVHPIRQDSRQLPRLRPRHITSAVGQTLCTHRLVSPKAQLVSQPQPQAVDPAPGKTPSSAPNRYRSPRQKVGAPQGFAGARFDQPGSAGGSSTWRRSSSPTAQARRDGLRRIFPSSSLLAPSSSITLRHHL